MRCNVLGSTILQSNLIVLKWPPAKPNPGSIFGGTEKRSPSTCAFSGTVVSNENETRRPWEQDPSKQSRFEFQIQPPDDIARMHLFFRILPGRPGFEQILRVIVTVRGRRGLRCCCY